MFNYRRFKGILFTDDRKGRQHLRPEYASPSPAAKILVNPMFGARSFVLRSGTSTPLLTLLPVWQNRPKCERDGILTHY